MLDRLVAALKWLLRAVAVGGNKEAGRMEENCAGGSKGDGERPAEESGDGHTRPPRPVDDDGPVEDITYTDQVVEVNIKSDFEGEITMNQATKDAAEHLKECCDAFLQDENRAGDLKQAMRRMGSSMGDQGKGQDEPGTGAPIGGGDLPPFVTVNVNVTKQGE
ncbi:MAG: hypothetical protein AAGA68_25685 [Pseudomonadota bacterium]